ncbi:uncharacterized protein UTRI_02505 [Ustilago trichophora]|uniref:Uncharacterized protein n=1 Tax=Ustilago trichophora TaxID=86804 RepID=A0A5C3EAK1_9BASI|nr:uncharacterized protein UTRI_02505 [Ustilago trichophora]
MRIPPLPIEKTTSSCPADADASAPNTDDELGSDLPDDDDGADRDLYDHDHDDDGAPILPPAVLVLEQAAIVLRAQQQSAARSASIHATNKRMESLALSSESYSEQLQREKREQAAQLTATTPTATTTSSLISGHNPISSSSSSSSTAVPPPALLPITRPLVADRWFGHLREVDERGYVSAIDNEHADVPLQYPRTKFLQVQAAAIGFGRQTNNDDDDDDEEYDEYNPKTLEILPTVLIYRQGSWLLIWYGWIWIQCGTRVGNRMLGIFWMHMVLWPKVQLVMLLIVLNKGW